MADVTTKSVTVGRIFNVQRFCTQDGPGIRTTVFLKGCPMECFWCHNPEGIRAEPEIMLYGSRCIECGACLEVCPNRVAGEPEGTCIHCGACVSVCPAGAREMAGLERTVEEVVRDVRKDSIFYDQTGGGVTFSGGEPLQQPGFLIDCLERLQGVGVHTAVDTGGYAPENILQDAARHTDLFLYDVKHMDSRRHAEITGVPNDLILSNLRALGGKHANIWLRIPILPGVNDDGENLTRTAELAGSIPGIRKICLLPYHDTGRAKRRKLERDASTSPVVSVPSGDHIRSLFPYFQNIGVDVSTGG